MGVEGGYLGFVLIAGKDLRDSSQLNVPAIQISSPGVGGFISPPFHGHRALVKR